MGGGRGVLPDRIVVCTDCNAGLIGAQYRG